MNRFKFSLLLVFLVLLSMFASAKNTQEFTVKVGDTKYVESFGRQYPLEVKSIFRRDASIVFDGVTDMMRVWESKKFKTREGTVTIHFKSFNINDGEKYVTFDFSHEEAETPINRIAHDVDSLASTPSTYLTLSTGESRKMQIGEYDYELKLVKGDLPFIVYTFEEVGRKAYDNRVRLNDAKNFKKYGDHIWIRPISAKRFGQFGSAFHEVTFYIDSDKNEVYEIINDNSEIVDSNGQNDGSNEVYSGTTGNIQGVNVIESIEENTEDRTEELITAEQIGELAEQGIIINNEQREFLPSSGFESITGGAGGVNIIENAVKQSLTKDCNGCKSDGNCYPFGMRFKLKEKPVFCDADKAIYLQKKDNAACDNNYECSSNICAVGFCTSNVEKKQGVFSKILSMFDLFS